MMNNDGRLEITFVLSNLQKSLEPMRRFEDNINHRLNRIDIKDASSCNAFLQQLQDLWQSRKAILDKTLDTLENELRAYDSPTSSRDSHYNFLKNSVCPH